MSTGTMEINFALLSDKSNNVGFFSHLGRFCTSIEPIFSTSALQWGKLTGTPTESRDEEVNGFHIHFATERYQLKGLREDAYAEATGRYNNLNDALEVFDRGCNF